MPVQTTYPGIHVQEIPSGVRTIAGVSTSIAAFVDYFPFGVLNEPIQLLSEADIERKLGGLHDHSEASYGLQQFFLNGGKEAWAVRVLAQLPGNNNQPFGQAAISILDSNGAASIDFEAGRYDPGANPNSLNPGTWANDLRIVVDHLESPAANLRFSLTFLLTDRRTGRIRDSEVFTDLSVAPNDPRFVRTIINDRFSGSRWLRITGVGAQSPAQSGTVSGPFNAPVLPANPQVDVVVSFASGNPPASPPLRITLQGQINTLADARRVLTEAIRAIPSIANPPLTPEVSEVVSQATVSSVNNQLTVLAGPQSRWDATISFADVGGPGGAATLLNLTAATVISENSQRYNLGFGTAVQLPGTFQGITEAGIDPDPRAGAANRYFPLPQQGELIGSLAQKTGIYALENVDLFNIVCIPAMANIAQPDPDALVAAVNAYCQRRRVFFILDIPNNINDMQGMRAWIDAKANYRNINNAVYFPRIVIQDPLHEFRPREIGASGALAGIYARTDAQRGIWKAPAGIEATLNNVSRIEQVLTNDENGVLNQIGVNCIRLFGTEGFVSWGARTTMGLDAVASEWRYLSVRRTANFIEESLARGLRWVLFEPNDEPLWAQIRLNVGAFMHDLFRQSAFQGRTKDEAYFVRCDSTTTTQTDRNLGVVNIRVGYAPLRPAEFVVLTIQQMAGQIQT